MTKWRDGAQQGNRQGKQDQYHNEGTEGERGFCAKNCLSRPRYDGARDQRNQSAEEGRPDYDLQQDVGSRHTIGEPSAEEVTDGQIEQHQADDVGPDQVAVAENVAQQPRCRQFDGQGGHAADEGYQVQVSLAHNRQGA